MARILSKGEKRFDWVGSSKRDFLGFPEPVKDGQCAGSGTVRREAPGGQTLERPGSRHLRAGRGPRWEHLQGGLHSALQGSRVRAAAFQKKSTKGIKTARLDVDLVERRLKAAQHDYEERYGKAKR
jgi:hypothetical protein